MIKRFNHANKLKFDSLQLLKELNEQYGIDEHKILISINENQQENNGIINLKLFYFIKLYKKYIY